MTKREQVLAAVSHQSSSIVPFSIRLTGEAYKAYGDQLLSDYANKDVQEDLKEGLITQSQAIDLSMGNFMTDVYAPWWAWNYEAMPADYADPFAEPTEMPPVIRHDTEENYEKYYAQVAHIAKRYETYIDTLIWGSHWEKAYFTRGIENFLADIGGAPEFAQKLLTYIVDLNMEILPKIACCKQTDGVLLGSDWGTQNDLIMSPTAWRTMIKPGEKRQYELLKSYGKQVMVHSCGCILRVLPEVVELGVDILNPVQPECMDLAFLKENYGDHLTFWGGISTQQTLPYGTPEEVKKETARVIELLSKNGGYITCPSQEIQTDVPYENLRALIDTARYYGGISR